MKLSILLSLVVLGIACALPSNSITGESGDITPNTSWLHILKKAVTKLVQKIWYTDVHCHGYDCPKFKRMEKTDDYELRCYKSYAWATTEYTGKKLVQTDY